jgi:hypothetical protein
MTSEAVRTISCAASLRGSDWCPLRLLREPRLVIRSFTVLLLPVLGSVPAHAQDEYYDHDRARVYLGAFIASRDTSTRLDSGSGRGTEIDMERDLGLERNMTVARLSGAYWFKPRQRLDVSTFDLSRWSIWPLEKTIEFGDYIFEIGTTVNANFDFQVYEIDYTFTPISRPKGFLGINSGLHVSKMRLSLIAQRSGTAEAEDVTAPLPVIGLTGRYEISNRLAFYGLAQFFSIDTGDASGSLKDMFLGLDYSFGPRMAVGIGYNYVEMRISVDEGDDFRGRLNWDYDGFFVYWGVKLGQSRR